MVDEATLRPLYPKERDLVPIAQEPGWGLGMVWTGKENPFLNGIRTPNRPAVSDSLS